MTADVSDSVPVYAYGAVVFTIMSVLYTLTHTTPMFRSVRCIYNKYKQRHGKSLYCCGEKADVGTYVKCMIHYK